MLRLDQSSKFSTTAALLSVVCKEEVELTEVKPAEVKSGGAESLISFTEAFRILDENIDRVVDAIMKPGYLNYINVEKYDPYFGPPVTNNVTKLDFLPCYFIKTNAYSRIEGRSILQKCITENKLDLLFLSSKKDFTIPSEKITKHHINVIPLSLCVSQEIKGTQDKAITLAQAKQLCILAKETDFGDLAHTNLIFCEDGRVAIIDTELRGFRKKRYQMLSPILATLHKHNKFESDALKFIEDEIAKINAIQEQERERLRKVEESE